MWVENDVNIEKVLPVAIFKMATTIPHKFNIVRFQRPELILDIENFLPVSISKWPPQYRKNSTLFDFKGSFNLFFKRLSVAGLGDFIIVRL